MQEVNEDLEYDEYLSDVEYQEYIKNLALTGSESSTIKKTNGYIETNQTKKCTSLERKKKRISKLPLHKRKCHNRPKKKKCLNN